MKIFAETYSTVQNTKNRMSEMTKKRQACGLKGTYKDSRPLLVKFYITTKTERYLPSKIFVCINDYRSEANPDNHHLYTMHHSRPMHTNNYRSEANPDKHHLYTMHHSRPMHTDGENDYITYIHCTYCSHTDKTQTMQRK